MARRRRRCEPVLGARVGALAVDDHRRGEHEPAGSRAGHRRQQDRGPQVVASGVERGVVEVDAKPDHGREVADRADAVQRRVDRLGVANVAMNELEAGIAAERRDAVGVGARQQRVKHTDLVTCAHERLDHAGPDKAGAAGHQYSHGLRLGAATAWAWPVLPAITSL
jgi:hypothetical protein